MIRLKIWKTNHSEKINWAPSRDRKDWFHLHQPQCPSTQRHNELSVLSIYANLYDVGFKTQHEVCLKDNYDNEDVIFPKLHGFRLRKYIYDWRWILKTIENSLEKSLNKTKEWILPCVGSGGEKASLWPTSCGVRLVKLCIYARKYRWFSLLCASWSESGRKGWMYLSPRPGWNTPAISCLNIYTTTTIIHTPLLTLFPSPF